MMPPKTGNPFVRRWRITEMELWDREDLDLLGPAFIEFDREGLTTRAWARVAPTRSARYAAR